MKKINVCGTSINALKGSRKTRDTNKQRVFDELLKHGDEGLTTKEVEILVGDPDADSRVWELIKSGWVVRTDRKKRNPGKRGDGTGAVATIIIVPKQVRKTGNPILLAAKSFRRKAGSKSEVRYEQAKAHVISAAKEWASSLVNCTNERDVPKNIPLHYKSMVGILEALNKLEQLERKRG